MASENSILHANKNLMVAGRIAGWPTLLYQLA